MSSRRHCVDCCCDAPLSSYSHTHTCTYTNTHTCIFYAHLPTYARILIRKFSSYSTAHRYTLMLHITQTCHQIDLNCMYARARCSCNTVFVVHIRWYIRCIRLCAMASPTKVSWQSASVLDCESVMLTFDEIGLHTILDG